MSFMHLMQYEHIANKLTIIIIYDVVDYKNHDQHIYKNIRNVTLVFYYSQYSQTTVIIL